MSNISRYLMCFMIVPALLLSACGSDSTNVTAPEIQALPASLKVNAGTNLVIDENQSVNLLGGSSGGEGAHTYAWSNEHNIEIEHTDTTITNAVFTAPSVTQTTVYTLTLTVTDDNQTQQSESIDITVNPINELPIVSIEATQIDGYLNDNYPLAATIVLDASGSTDADPQTESEPITAYTWQQIAGPDLLTGLNVNLSTLSMVVPALNETTEAVFRLTVSDQEQASSSADYSVTLLSQQETNTLVETSSVRTVFAGEIAVLEAVASSIAPDASPFSAFWDYATTPNTLLNLETYNHPQIQDATAFVTPVVAPLVSETTNFDYTISVTDSFRNITTAQSQAIVHAPSVRLINDTGVTVFATQASLSTFYPHDYPGQDASYGADRQVASGTLAKMGEGDSGFDFTRLDELGDPFDDNSISFACVRDNISGLVWQVKDNVNTTSLHYVEQSFTWYSEDDNGNFEGALNLADTSCTVQSQACNTQAYIDAVNSEGLCGSFDWRLPSVYELQSILHYGQDEPPLVDNAFFPYLGAGSVSSSGDETLWYWTMQSSAEGVSDDIARNAWAYDFNTGNDASLDKTTSHKVILVRAGR